MAGIVSEEEESIICTGNRRASYVVALDPLDGSSNIDVNVSIGTIFTVFRRISPIDTPVTAEDFLQGGRLQIAAGYVLYGTSTVMVYTTGHGVNAFTYEQSLGEYFLSHADMKLPAQGSSYAVNDGNFYDFPPAVQGYLEQCRRRQYSARYIGALVGDFHRILLKGGLYLYPSTAKAPNGKLRLLYECFPLAWLAEQAAGCATDGRRAILDVPITGLHQRTPLFIGSEQMVSELQSRM